MMSRQKKDVYDLVKTSLEGKTVLCVSDLFALIKQLMEYVEKFNFLSGHEKRDIIYENLKMMLCRGYTGDVAGQYMSLINPYIENTILISQSKLLLNMRRGCLKQCSF